MPDIKRKIRVVFDHFYYASIIKKAVAQLNERSIVATPTIDWQMPLFQRPQHLAQQLSQLGYDFFYLTTNHEEDQVHGLKKLATNLFISNQYRRFINEAQAGWFLILAGQPLVTLEQIVALKKRGAKIIYDYADEINEEIARSEKGTSLIFERHKQIKKLGLADLVLCTSQKLYQEMEPFFAAEKILYCPNGVDYENFVGLAKGRSTPDDLKSIIESKKPIVGYYGALAKWIDYDYLKELAQKKPNCELILIGLDYDGSLGKSRLLELSNVHYLGVKKYQELPRYAKHFDVALIPFVRGEIAQATSPLKFFEYMALEIPTVVTKDLQECAQYKTTLVAESKSDFVKKVEQGMKSGRQKELKKKYQIIAQANTWQVRAKQIDQAIKALN